MVKSNFGIMLHVRFKQNRYPIVVGSSTGGCCCISLRLLPVLISNIELFPWYNPKQNLSYIGVQTSTVHQCDSCDMWLTSHVTHVSFGLLHVTCDIWLIWFMCLMHLIWHMSHATHAACNSCDMSLICYLSCYLLHVTCNI